MSRNSEIKMLQELCWNMNDDDYDFAVWSSSCVQFQVLGRQVVIIVIFRMKVFATWTNVSLEFDISSHVEDLFT